MVVSYCVGKDFESSSSPVPMDAHSDDASAVSGQTPAMNHIDLSNFIHSSSSLSVGDGYKAW